MKIFRILTIIILFAFVFMPFEVQSAPKTKTKKTVRTIEVQTSDEMMLVGTLTVPPKATIKEKAPLVILLHSLGSDRTIYKSLSEKLKEKGIASLALDLRGHHDSITRLNGKKSYWQSYSNIVYEKYPNDIISVLDFIKENYVAIDVDRVGFLGADVSANASIIASSNTKYNVKTLVLVSPSMSFKNLKTATPLVSYGEKPITIIVTRGDIYHYNAANELKKYAQGEVNLIPVKSGGTGDVILKLNPSLEETITDWFVEKL